MRPHDESRRRLIQRALRLTLDPRRKPAVAQDRLPESLQPELDFEGRARSGRGVEQRDGKPA